LGVETDASSEQEKMVEDKYPYMITLANQVRIVLNAMDTAEDAGISAMLHLITLAIPIVRRQYKPVLQEERAKFKHYVRDEVHLSVPLAGYAIPGERHLRSVEEGKRCEAAYWRVEQGDVQYETVGERRETEEDAALWRRMKYSPVPYRKSGWLSKLRAEVDDELDLVLDALHDAELLVHTRRNEPAGGEL